jgi:phosphoglycerol transferase MdoB-like AlkP superfamily enzyme
MVSLVLGARAAHVAPPTYNKTLIQAFEQSHASPRSTPTKPDIVLWLGESFFDPGVIAGVDTCDVLPTFCQLTSSQLRSNINVPTYGGNTTRTEFEVLTAIPFAMLGGRDYPYVTSVHRPFDSIAQTLKQSGYHNIAIHPHHKTFWQRHRAFPLLGFDEFLGEKDIKGYKRDGVWISDNSLADQVMLQLDKAQKPTFLFAISMEGHGSFGSQDKIDEDRVNAIKALEGVENKGDRMWREYIYHARNTARALKRLKTYIEQRSRPTLVVFFGDHLPGLSPLYQQVTFTNGGSVHQQKTPTLAMANYPVNPEWLPHFSYELGLWTLQLAGETGTTPLQRLLQATGLSYQDQDTALGDTITTMQARQLSAPYKPQ